MKHRRLKKYDERDYQHYIVAQEENQVYEISVLCVSHNLHTSEPIFSTLETSFMSLEVTPTFNFNFLVGNSNFEDARVREIGIAEPAIN